MTTPRSLTALCIHISLWRILFNEDLLVTILSGYLYYLAKHSGVLSGWIALVSYVLLSMNCSRRLVLLHPRCAMSYYWGLVLLVSFGSFIFGTLPVWCLVSEWREEIVMSGRRPEGLQTARYRSFSCLLSLLICWVLSRVPFSIFFLNFLPSLPLAILCCFYLLLYLPTWHDYAYVFAFRGILFSCMFVLIYTSTSCMFQLCVHFTS